MSADDPAIPFLRYSLAMELDKEGQHEQSLSLLSRMQRDSPPYVRPFSWRPSGPARLDHVDQAKATLRVGIAATRLAGNASRQEIQEFLRSLG